MTTETTGGFRKATKRQAKLRAALYGPSGSGKTMTALRVATGMGGRIAVIDTERGSAEKYADRFDFDVCEPAANTIDGYLACFKLAASGGYSVLVVDSLSHAWKELLAEIDKLANARFRGNTFAAWSEGTPKQNRLVDAILQYPGHIIATMRADTEWSQETDHRGKVKPVKVGLKPQQGKGIEYEFDLLAAITPEHTLIVEKDRTGKFQDSIIELPGEDFGRDLMAWLSDGTPSDRKQAANVQRGDSGNWQQWLTPPDGCPVEWYLQAVKGLLAHCGARGVGQVRQMMTWLIPDSLATPGELKTDPHLARIVWDEMCRKSNDIPFTRMLAEACKAVASDEPEV